MLRICHKVTKQLKKRLAKKIVNATSDNVLGARRGTGDGGRQRGTKDDNQAPCRTHID